MVTVHRMTPRVPAGGEGIPVTIRIPRSVLTALDRRLTGGVIDVRNRSEALTDALGVWLLLLENQEKSDV